MDDNIKNFIKILSTKNKLLLKYNLDWMDPELDNYRLSIDIGLNGYCYYDDLISV